MPVFNAPAPSKARRFAALLLPRAKGRRKDSPLRRHSPPAIVSPALVNAVQEEIDRRASRGFNSTSASGFTGKLIRSDCDGSQENGNSWAEGRIGTSHGIFG